MQQDIILPAALLAVCLLVYEVSSVQVPPVKHSYTFNQGLGEVNVPAGSCTVENVPLIVVIIQEQQNTIVLCEVLLVKGRVIPLTTVF